jgi:hypothetical protein
MQRACRYTIFGLLYRSIKSQVIPNFINTISQNASPHYTSVCNQCTVQYDQWHFSWNWSYKPSDLYVLTSCANWHQDQIPIASYPSCSTCTPTHTVSFAYSLTFQPNLEGTSSSIQEIYGRVIDDSIAIDAIRTNMKQRWCHFIIQMTYLDISDIWCMLTPPSECSF